MPQLLLPPITSRRALKLPTFLREYDKLAQQCAAEGIDHPRYLLRLAELELDRAGTTDGRSAASRRRASQR